MYEGLPTDCLAVSAGLNEHQTAQKEEAWLCVFTKDVHCITLSSLKVGAVILFSPVSSPTHRHTLSPMFQTHSCMERLQYSMWRGVPFLLNCTTV